MISLYTSIAFSLINLFQASAASDAKTLRMEDWEYENKVKSVLMVQSNSDERFPLIGLNKANALMVTCTRFAKGAIHYAKKLRKLGLNFARK